MNLNVWILFETGSIELWLARYLLCSRRLLDSWFPTCLPSARINFLIYNFTIKVSGTFLLWQSRCFGFGFVGYVRWCRCSCCRCLCFCFLFDSRISWCLGLCTFHLGWHSTIELYPSPVINSLNPYFTEYTLQIMYFRVSSVYHSPICVYVCVCVAQSWPWVYSVTLHLGFETGSLI